MERNRQRDHYGLKLMEQEQPPITLDDVSGMFELVWAAEEEFPDAWRVFFAEFDESREARREAFATLLGYINSHFEKRAPGFARVIDEERQRLICLALLSTLPAGTLDHVWQVQRYFDDLVPVDEDLVPGNLPPFDSAAFLASIPPPSARPTGKALLRAGNRVEVFCDSNQRFELVVNHRDDVWDFVGATSQGSFIDVSASEPTEDDPAPPTPPEMWSYRLRHVEWPPPGSNEIKPFGMWSEPIPVTPPI